VRGLKSILDNNVIVEWYPGAEDTNPKLYLIKDNIIISSEINYWLKNLIILRK